jgi:glycine cleavage system aminomethyltransferase T
LIQINNASRVFEFPPKEQIMKLPAYVTIEEVKRVCNEIGLRDWSEITDPSVSGEEASTILNIVNVKKMEIPLDVFRKGLEVELEHGTRFEDANVTNNHPVLTGMIVIAHLKETIDYYERIDVAEIEGDLLKAIQSRNVEKIESKYKKLIEAQKSLNQAVINQLK